MTAGPPGSRSSPQTSRHSERFIHLGGIRRVGDKCCPRDGAHPFQTLAPLLTREGVFAMESAAGWTTGTPRLQPRVLVPIVAVVVLMFAGGVAVTQVPRGKTQPQAAPACVPADSAVPLGEDYDPAAAADAHDHSSDT